MSDAKRYKAALVSQYSDVVLAIDHDAALAAKDAEIASIAAMATMLENMEWAEHAAKGDAAHRIEACITVLLNEIAAKDARIAELEASLRQFMKCAYPVSDVIEASGHAWCNSWLDESLQEAERVMGDQQADPTMAKNANVAATPSEDGGGGAEGGGACSY